MYLPREVSVALIRLADLIQRRQVWAAYRSLEASQWWDAGRLHEFQMRKRRERVQDLAKRSPLVRKRMQQSGIEPASIRAVEDLARLPVLEKDDLRHRAAALMARGLSPGDVRRWSSGGSTGSNVSFFVDRGGWRQRDATMLRMLNFLGLGPGARMVTIWGQPWDLQIGRLWKERIRRGIENRHLFSAYRLSQDELDAILEWLGRNRLDILMGFTSIIDHLARRAIQRGGMEGPRYIISCAEALFPDQRRRMESAWDTQVFNQYGCREFGVLGMECPERAGLHLMDERVIVERIDGGANGLGEVLITDLDNRATPFLRYRIGDQAMAGESGPCPCGRGLSRLGDVSGRTFDIIRGPSGRAVGGTFFSVLLRTGVKGVESFQIVQQSLDLIEVRVAPTGSLDSAARLKVTGEIRKALGESIRVEFTEVARMDPLPSGKHRFVVAMPGTGAGESR
ncbi:MAG: phenylacetate--CoA ligase family protein [Acidobacteriota bacterium]